jgi:hypothetical protein
MVGRKPVAEVQSCRNFVDRLFQSELFRRLRPLWLDAVTDCHFVGIFRLDCAGADAMLDTQDSRRASRNESTTTAERLKYDRLASPIRREHQINKAGRTLTDDTARFVFYPPRAFRR